MSATRKLTIEFIGKDTSAGRAASSLEQKYGKLGATMNKVGQVSGRILAGGLLLAGAAAVKATQAAAEDEQAQVKLADTLRKAAGATDAQIASTENWITAQGKALGVTDDELRPAISKLAVATGDLEEAQRLAALAMDISAGSGKGLDSVVTALQKAQNGSVGGLARLGVATKNAAGETKSFDEIQQDLAKTYTGAAAKAADTTAGKQKILQVQFAELQEEIGTKLLPAMTQLAAAGLEAVNWISNNATTVKVLVGSLTALLAITWATTKAIAVWTALTKVAAAAQIIFTNVQWALNAAMAANPVGLVVIAIAALVAGLIIAYKKSETFRKIVDGAFAAVAKAAKVAVDFIRGNWKNILAILTGPIGIAVRLITANWSTIKAGASAVLNWLRGAWAKVKEILTTPIRVAVSTILNIWDRVGKGFSAAKDKISSTVNQIKSSLTSGFQAMLSPIQAVIDKVEWLINKLKSVKLPNLGGVLGRVSASAGGGMSFAEFRDGLKGFFSSAFSANLSDPETGAAPTIDSLLAYQQAELAKAQKLQADIAMLVSKGVTKDVLDQIAASGPGGAAQISALAAGTSGQIAQFAAMSAATMGALSGAGLAGSAGYTAGGASSNGMNQGLLKKLVEQGERENKVDVKLTGDQIVWAIRKYERKLGVRLLVT